MKLLQTSENAARTPETYTVAVQRVNAIDSGSTEQKNVK